MGGVNVFAGAVTAWRVLRRLLDYRRGWLAAAGRTGSAEGAPIPIRSQTGADLEAAPWGLLAWQDPFAEDGPASPFWADAPMVEGKQAGSGTQPFADLVRSQKGSVSGLLLLDGTLILKVERNGAAGQVRIEDGTSFDPAGGLGLFLPWGEDHMERAIDRADDLRAVVCGEGVEGRPFPPRSRTSWSSRLRAVSRRSRRA